MPYVIGTAGYYCRANNCQEPVLITILRKIFLLVAIGTNGKN
jgi:hypothetical protein